MGFTTRLASGHLVGRYPGWQIDLHHLPKSLFQGHQWFEMKAGFSHD
jgi:hypothetical protein